MLVRDPVEHRGRPRGTARTTRPRSRRSPCRLRSRTSVSNVSLVALVAMSFLSGSVLRRMTTTGEAVSFPLALHSPRHVHAATGRARSPALELEILDRLGAGGHLRAAPRAEPRRPDAGRSSTARSPRTSRSGCTRRGGGRSRTSSSATRRCAASTSATRTASTARGSGSRSASSARSGSTRSARSRSTGSRSSRARCREVVVKSSEALTRGSIRLGQWMDWGNDYFTFSDTNIEYIWRFLKIVHERGWLYMGHRATEWCPRCGTSLSQHELTQSGVYQERADPSLFVRFPLLDRPGESVVVWTTTPWTLPANVAAAVHPEARVRAARERRVGRSRALPGRHVRRRVQGAELVGLRYEGRSTTSRPARRSSTASSRGTRSRSRKAPASSTSRRAAGPRTSSSARRSACRCCTPVDEAGRFYDDYGWLHGLSTAEAADQIVGDLGERGFLVEAGTYPHNYPHCWRCDTPLICRISDDWFISRRRAPPAAARGERDRALGAGLHGQAHGRLAAQHGRLEHLAPPLLRPAAAVLPVRVRAPERDRVEGRARASARSRASSSSRSCAGRGSTACRSAASRAARRSTRILEVGDVWLDAGIVPFSTLGWENPSGSPTATPPAPRAGSRAADLPDHAYWEKWFPADWVTEMREQIRLWFYSQLFMSVALVGRAPFRRVLGYEKMLDEHGREMHGSWGNMIDAEDAFARMGADVMRWQYCAQPPDRNLLFGFGPAHEIKRKLLTLWNSVGFLVHYANIAGFEPTSPTSTAGRRTAAARPLARRARRRSSSPRPTRGYEATLTVDVIARVRGVRRRPLELVHPPLAPALLARTTRRRSRRSGTRSCSRCA